MKRERDIEFKPTPENREGVKIYNNGDMKKDALDTQVGGNHYKQFVIQPIEFTVKNKLGFCEGNIIKYISRHKFKNGIEDLKKAKHYIDLLMELEYKNESK